MNRATQPLSHAYVHLDRLTHNVKVLERLAGRSPIWPVLKANAYGHDAALVGRHLRSLGYETFCVAHPAEALDLVDAGVDGRFVVLSPTLPEQAEVIVENGLEPVVCTTEMVAALSREALRRGDRVAVHLAVDTGMGRIGIACEDVVGFLDRCRSFQGVHVRGIASHFPRADEGDTDYSEQQLARFLAVANPARESGVEVRHMANSAALFELPDARLDAVRAGVALYGLRPSPAVSNPVAAELRPALEWKTRITFLKEVGPDTGLSYGHTYRTRTRALIATALVGYGDGLSRRLSSDMTMLVRGHRCAQVGRITMDTCLLDVTAVAGEVRIGDEVVILGRQGADEITAEEVAARLGTIGYEVVTRIGARVPRIAVGGAV